MPWSPSTAAKMLEPGYRSRSPRQVCSALFSSFGLSLGISANIAAPFAASKFLELVLLKSV